ncbi:hypothetical protein QBC36DRAFT_335186 [Triangularia setosa]|uniref:Uncharacterized protein n=1 Tax=Triangularia setosa TaxID=2587417 RepID=A0AAN7A569_9PEZI|nr:hypothetical protein QBC36DRAFT_335186 [Podospora setosa]
MKLSLAVVAVAAAFSSTVLAHSSSPADLLEMRAAKGKGKHNHHEHPKHDFRLSCICEPDQCPTFLTSKALCECKAAHLEGCYLKSQRGCPKPSAKKC